MRCRQGDLAIVINADHVKHNIGRIVEVLRLAVSGEKVAHGFIGECTGWQGWVVRPAGGGKMDSWCSAGFWLPADEVLCLDRNLRPIRDPGDDAVDETLLRLPSPRQEVTA